MLILCTLCHEVVNQADNIGVTECMHVFHYDCLAQWMGSNSTCPECRNTGECVFERLLLTISDERTDDVITLQFRLDHFIFQLSQQKATCTAYEKELEKLKIELKENDKLRQTYESELAKKDTAITTLMVQIQETYQLLQENEGSATGAVCDFDIKKNEVREWLVDVGRPYDIDEVQEWLFEARSAYENEQYNVTEPPSRLITFHDIKRKNEEIREWVVDVRRAYEEEESNVTEPPDRLNLNAVRNPERSAEHKAQKEWKLQYPSIFHRIGPLQPEPSERPTKVSLDVCYNGLGGHSILDTFSIPLQK